ncbi:hypothetical protein QTP86_012418 [Hemibagrus guttatus]|nr:hypothetical protein QTP86_012418 [Hemibagrus guttatus]
MPQPPTTAETDPPPHYTCPGASTTFSLVSHHTFGRNRKGILKETRPDDPFSSTLDEHDGESDLGGQRGSPHLSSDDIQMPMVKVAGPVGEPLPVYRPWGSSDIEDAQNKSQSKRSGSTGATGTSTALFVFSPLAQFSSSVQKDYAKEEQQEELFEGEFETIQLTDDDTFLGK